MKLTPQILAMYLGARFVLRIKGTESLSAPMYFGVDALAASLSTDALVKIDPIMILRRLSDMTEEEAREWLKMKYNGVPEIRMGKTESNGFWYQFHDKDGVHVGNNRFLFKNQTLDENNPEQFAYLLSRSFDLFGLIDANEAIDSKTLKA